MLCSASSCCLRELARGLRRLHALDVVLHLRGGVGDVGGDLQLDLPELRFDLVRLQLRARVRGFLRARAERIA